MSADFTPKSAVSLAPINKEANQKNQFNSPNPLHHKTFIKDFKGMKNNFFYSFYF